MVIWQGKSRFATTEDISVVAVMKTENGKTGDMVQTFIMPDKEFVRKEDRANRKIVCGNCPLLDAGACYVNVAWAVLAVWKKLRAGRYPKLDLNAFKDRAVRLGSYGEPVLMPLTLFQAIIKIAKCWTGYTHAWENDWAQPYQQYLMASVQTAKQKAEANAKGWKTFRTVASIEDKLPDEVLCPASAEYLAIAGKKATCEQCRLCCGRTSVTQKNVCIVAHGSKAIKGNLLELLAG